jgi:hypothetical protein
MNQWGFVAAAYAIAVLGTVALALQSFAAMRRAEAQAEAARRER